MKIWIDGQYYDKENAKISVFDHGMLYGDGCFEGIRAYNGKIFKLAEHLDRLYASAQAIGMKIPMALADMTKLVPQVVKDNDLKDCYIRLVVTRGVGDLGIDPRKCPKPSIICIATSIKLYPEEMYENGMKIVTASSRRVPTECLPGRIKSLNYLNNIMAKIEGIQANCEEVLLLNTAGKVAECSADNVFAVWHSGHGRAGKAAHLLTPSATQGALLGVTRGTILDLARKAGYTTEEGEMERYDLYTCDEVFLTGTGAEVIGVVGIDGRTIGTGKPGEVTRKLRSTYMEFVRS
ncbi:MAG TPA: branched-chain-amino-acid transaminase [Planctomycetota bacterium]|nr:branched-chain-amino-acid transaminase [Planctomycetota bacterium]